LYIVSFKFPDGSGRMDFRDLKCVSSDKFWKVWRKGGNWASFFVFWFISSAIMSALEQSEANRELTELDEDKRDLKLVMEQLHRHHEVIQNNTELSRQLTNIIKLVDNNQDDMARVFGMIDIEMAIVKEKMMSNIVNLFKDEFGRIEKEASTVNDTTVERLASQLVDLFSSKTTVNALATSGQVMMAKYVEGKKAAKASKAAATTEAQWSLGHSLHFTSSIFMNIGYGMWTPVTVAGKMTTILLILVQVPFYLHCLASSAAAANLALDRLLGPASQEDQLQLVEGRAGRSVVTALRGLAVLSALALVMLLLTAIYHYCTNDWPFTGKHISRLLSYV